MKDSQAHIISRRGFITGSACAIGGGIVLEGTGGMALGATTAVPDVGAWPYATLDPVAIAQSAWEPQGCQGCGGKSMGAIIYGLRAALGPGSPWDQLPINLGSFGNGGGPLSQTCGALMGPYLLMNLVGAGRSLGKEFFQWYSTFAFPSAEWDDYVPKSGHAPSKGLVSTVANSTLCSVSRSTWQKEYNRLYGQGAKEPYNDRCAKLICDCTKKAVELLNDWKAGNSSSDSSAPPGDPQAGGPVS